MKRLFCFIISIFSLNIYAQINSVSGVVLDKETSETLIGANVILEPINESIKTTGTATNINGEFEFTNLANGEYKINISYIGYESETRSISFSQKSNINLNITLNPDVVLDVISLVSDQAEFRKTPVSLSNVKLEQIENELAAQEIPMILNHTPGVYATQQGGGDGDVRINIRGFNQTNVAVMIDGVPMNDMENGKVYWSNWFGLDGLTKNIQVQRGLGASKLALPSVGGTINILTKGIDAEEGGMIKQEFGSGNYLRTSFAYSTRNFKIGKFNIAGSFKKSDGMVTQTPSQGLFYYLKWQKAIGSHVFSLSGFGAPQKHNQRNWKKDIKSYDTDFAAELGVDTTGVGADGDFGLLYNPNWGEYNNYDLVFETEEMQITNNLLTDVITSSDTIWNETKTVNAQKNYYHKPVLNFQHLWNMNDNSSITNLVYASFGEGGGTSIYNRGVPGPGGLIDFQTIYNNNSGNSYDISLADYADPHYLNYGISLNPLGIASIDVKYSTEENKSTNILESSINKHAWYGFLSTFNHKINNQLDLASGLDLRTYRGEHYREVYDLLGGDYFVGSRGSGEDNAVGYTATDFILREGDKIKYHNDGLVRWIGGFGQLEYDNNNISAFINLTGSQTLYKRIDYFKKRDLVFQDTIINQAVGITADTTYFDPSLGQYVTDAIYDTVYYNGQAYTMHSKEARTAETNWEKFPGFTFKTGVNWNIDEFNNVFLNTGVLSIAPKFNNVFGYDNYTYPGGSKNEIVKAIEMGYGYKNSEFALNFNAYHTIWENKPQQGYALIEGESVEYRIQGMNALHQGLELDFAYKISDAFTYEFLSSIGNWRWTSGDTVDFILNQQVYDTRYFDAEGIYVGDSPQTQIGSSVAYNYSLNKKINGYIKLKSIYFDRFFADYDPADAEGSDVWQLPSYTLFNLHIGSTFYLETSSIHLKLNVLNLFDTTYLSDAQNNDDRAMSSNPENSDAESAGVFFGLSRKIIASIEYKF
tara:strand:- start:152 stop:3109 length:2958 start_codon:yes stop_codon:yes gene_type:complete